MHSQWSHLKHAKREEPPWLLPSDVVLENREVIGILKKAARAVHVADQALRHLVAPLPIPPRSQAQAQRIRRIDMIHERLTAILIGHLINQTQPVIEHRLSGIAPGVVQMFQHLMLGKLR